AFGRALHPDPLQVGVQSRGSDPLSPQAGVQIRHISGGCPNPSRSVVAGGCPNPSRSVVSGGCPDPSPIRRSSLAPHVGPEPALRPRRRVSVDPFRSPSLTPSRDPLII